MEVPKEPTCAATLLRALRKQTFEKSLRELRLMQDSPRCIKKKEPRPPALYLRLTEPRKTNRARSCASVGGGCAGFGRAPWGEHDGSFCIASGASDDTFDMQAPMEQARILSVVFLGCTS